MSSRQPAVRFNNTGVDTTADGINRRSYGSTSKQKPRIRSRRYRTVDPCSRLRQETDGMAVGQLLDMASRPSIEDHPTKTRLRYKAGSKQQAVSLCLCGWNESVHPATVSAPIRSPDMLLSRPNNSEAKTLGTNMSLFLIPGKA